MYVEGYLLKGKKMVNSVSGTNVYLSQGERVQVVCKPSNHSYTLRRGDQVQLPRGLTFDTIEVTNLGAEGDISLVCIEGQFFPTMDGSKINFAADLEADNLEVRFEGRQPVELLPTQKIKAEVTNLPVTQSVQVENMPQAVEVQKVHIVQETAPNLRYVAHETMTDTGTISANSKRKELILKAADGNTGTIWLGGYENRGYGLRPAEAFILSNGAKVDVYLPANCELYVSEVTA